MPVSHVGLTVSHLPRSCSFYLSALQPLGYRYIGQQENQIAFGDKEAEFFICQDSPGYVDGLQWQWLVWSLLIVFRNRAGPAHVAFAATSQEEVHLFFSAALRAGGRPHGEPRLRDTELGYYSAAVVDFDDNAVEVVYRDSGRTMSTVSGSHASRLIEQASKSSIERSPLRDIINNVTTTVTTTTTTTPSPPQPKRIESSDSSKTLVGALFGAAAGAAIAYCLTREETVESPGQEHNVVRRTTMRQIIEPSPHLQSPHSLYDHESVSYVSDPLSRHTKQPLTIGAPQSIVSSSTEAAPSRTVEGSGNTPSLSRHAIQVRAIEAAPSFASDTPSRAPCQSSDQRAIEAAPSMVSGASSRRSHKSRRAPPAPTYYTVQEPSEVESAEEPEVIEEVLLPSPRSVTQASRASRVSTGISASKPPSQKSSSTVKTVTMIRTTARHSLPMSTQCSSHLQAAREVPASSYSKNRVEMRAASSIRSYSMNGCDVPLPASNKGSRYTEYTHDVPLPASSKASRYTEYTHDIPLPASSKTSQYTEVARDIPLPTSSKTPRYMEAPEQVPLSCLSRHTHSMRPSSHHSHGEDPPAPRPIKSWRGAHDVPLPASTKTSFVSRARSPTRSAASASTIKPMTQANVRRAATDTGLSDVDTVAPEDSISQMGNKPKSSHRRRRSEAGSRSGGSKNGRKPGSRVSMPRSIGRALGVTA
jgi:catechol 2,3-dioxygenase-like lactoylglutathione lyase family enzyme